MIKFKLNLLRFLFSFLLLTFPTIGTSKASQIPYTVSKAYIESALQDGAKKARVPYELLKAICSAESNLKPDAFAYNDGGQNNHAIGMCQVLINTAARFIKVDEGCRNNFNLSKNKRSYNSCNLFGPRINAYAAALYLKHQLDRYNGDEKKAVAAYNAGSHRHCGHQGYFVTRGRKHACKPGGPANMVYVSRVMGFLSEGS